MPFYAVGRDLFSGITYIDLSTPSILSGVYLDYGYDWLDRLRAA